MPTSSSPQPHLYQLKVSLRGISPLIWRRLLVRSNITIAALHGIVQIAMGWEDCHLHRFVIYGKAYGIWYEGGVGFDDDPRAVRLTDFEFRESDRFLYEYDFGDNWQHELRIEKIMPLDPKRTYPVCLDGKGACPPEDCGGAWQYMAILHILKNRSHPEKSRVRQWIGRSFDPAAFDRRHVNAQLKKREHPELQRLKA